MRSIEKIEFLELLSKSGYESSIYLLFFKQATAYKVSNNIKIIGSLRSRSAYVVG
jgi:hypothetical protein